MKTENTFDFSQMTISFSGIEMRKYRKEDGFYKSLILVGVVEGDLIELAQINYYKTKARNYACMWLSSPILSLYGVVGDYAGGYGYNKEHAAFEGCLDKMQIKTNGAFDDHKFLEGLACYLGVEKFKIVAANR